MSSSCGRPVDAGGVEHRLGLGRGPVDQGRRPPGRTRRTASTALPRLTIELAVLPAHHVGPGHGVERGASRGRRPAPRRCRRPRRVAPDVEQPGDRRRPHVDHARLTGGWPAASRRRRTRRGTTAAPCARSSTPFWAQATATPGGATRARSATRGRRCAGVFMARTTTSPGCRSASPGWPTAGTGSTTVSSGDRSVSPPACRAAEVVAPGDEHDVVAGLVQPPADHARRCPRPRR